MSKDKSAKKETIGKTVAKHQKEKSRETGTANVMELADYHLEKSDYMGELQRTVLENRDKDYFVGEDFFLEVITRKDKLLPDTLRNQFVAKKKCPSPAPASAAFQYIHSSEEIVFLWQLPRMEKCQELYENREKVVKEEQELLGYVIEFFNGDLMELAQTLSGETSKTLQKSVKIVEH